MLCLDKSSTPLENDEGVQCPTTPTIYPKGHITAHVLRGDADTLPPFRWRRYRTKMTKREKYVFKKMRALDRKRNPRHEDPGSDLTPLYDIIHPWKGFSRLQGKTQKLIETEIRSYSPKDEEAIGSFRQVLDSTIRLLPKDQRLKMEAIQSTDVSFYQSAEAAVQWEERGSRAEHVHTTIAANLQQKGIKKTKPVPLKPEPNEKQKEIDEALSRDPSFQQSALKLEAESDAIEDVDEWIGRLRNFAQEHGEVIDVLQGPENDIAVPDVRLAATVESSFRQQLMETGINIQRIEQRAQKEIEYDLSRRKIRCRPPSPKQSRD